MHFKKKFITKKQLKYRIDELTFVNDSLSSRNLGLVTTNKILKNYIRYLKTKLAKNESTCWFCDGKVRWVHDFGDNRYAIYYCPRCGHKIPWPQEDD